jgi:ubiquinone/menaquinone biosynthesis C-methylase UbiE
MNDFEYLMESEDEALRLDIKTDRDAVIELAEWAGLKPGMTVADIGCGSGKALTILHEIAVREGPVECVGIDGSQSRIEYAEKNYSGNGIKFICKDIRDLQEDTGSFDFVWVRFLLEYYRKESYEITRHLMKKVKPGGILCLADLDSNSLCFFGASERFEKTILSIMARLEKHANFDPYVGRKLYSYLYRLGFREIRVKVAAHHLIYGELTEKDSFNWFKKIDVISKKINYDFPEYPGGYDEFYREFCSFLKDPQRFIFTPLICCRGIRPSE